jgi:two-component system, NarL family, nitrate/nitrite response regulator NarL
MKILIVDDHPIYRKGLIALLDQMEPDTALLQANDGIQGLALIAEHDDLDVVILDLVIPGMDGLRAIAEFGKIRPELPVIVLSSSENPADVRAALANGALGYVPKSAAEHTLLTAIRVVLIGRNRAVGGFKDRVRLRQAGSDRPPDRSPAEDQRRPVEQDNCR